jgi:hypothetical protein
MAVFAFLYHPTRTLSDAELAERAQRVRAWTLAQREAGRVLVVSVFEAGARLLPQDAPTDRALEHESALAGCTFVQAEDMADALGLASAFPGRAFGTEVEVRPVGVFLTPAR